MKRYFGISLACFSSLLLIAGVVLAKPTTEPQVFSPVDEYLDVVGPADGTPAVSKAAQDTIWIADWSFDPGCSNNLNDDSTAGEQVTGWFRSDLHILNDGQQYWHIRNSFDGALVDTLGAGAGDDKYISGNAAVLTNHDLCWGFPDGYGTS